MCLSGYIFPILKEERPHYKANDTINLHRSLKIHQIC